MSQVTICENCRSGDCDYCEDYWDDGNKTYVCVCECRKESNEYGYGSLDDDDWP